MNSHALLNSTPRIAPSPTRRNSARRLVRIRMLPALRPVIVRHIPLVPSIVARIEDVLTGVTFLGLAGLAVIMEAFGTSLF
jgi:hypothetical protein